MNVQCQLIDLDAPHSYFVLQIFLLDRTDTDARGRMPPLLHATIFKRNKNA